MLTQSLTPTVTVINGVPKTTSLDVAFHFNKQHYNVLRDIKNLDCSDDFTKLNFEVCFKNNELQNGKPQPYYAMTKDGFTFLAMGYTGKEAARFKEAYIKRFNEMEAELQRAHHQRLDITRILEQLIANGQTLATAQKQNDTLMNLLIDGTIHPHAKMTYHNDDPFCGHFRVIGLLDLINDAIDLGTYPHPYQIRNENQQHVLIVKLLDVLDFLRTLKVQSPFKSTQAMRAELNNYGLIARDPFHFYRSKHDRYMNCTMIDLHALKSLKGGVQ